MHALLTHLASRGFAIDYLCLEPMLEPSQLFGRVPPGADYLARLCSPYQHVAGAWLVQRRPVAWLRWHVDDLFRRAKGALGGAWTQRLKRLRAAVFPRPANAKHVSEPAGEPPLYELDFAQLALLRRMAGEREPDIVMVDYTRHATVFEHLPAGSQKVLVTHDILHQRAASFQRFGAAPDFAAHSRTVEAGLLGRADTLVAIQAEDAKLLRTMAPGRQVVVAPMPAVFPRTQAGAGVPGRCMFVGGSSEANADGVRWLVGEVWPLVRARCQAATLAVYGNVCEKVGGTIPGVTFHGPIDQLAGAYAEAEVCVVPLRIGSGLKIKLIEAAAHGRAVVSTTLGVQGLEALAGSAIPVADDPAAFAEWVERLLAESELRSAFARALAGWVAEHLRPDAAFAELECSLRS